MAALDASHFSDGEAAAFIRERGDARALDLAVEGAWCGACISKIEGGVGELPGVRRARLNLSSGRLTVSFDGPDALAEHIVRAIEALGYGARPYLPETAADAAVQEEKALLRAMAVAGFATANVMLLSIAVWSGAGEMAQSTRTLLHWISGAIALPAVAYSARPFFMSALRALKARRVNMDVPISLGVTLACALSVYETAIGHGDAYFDAAVMLLFFLLIGRYLDMRLRARAGAAARRLAALEARAARRVEADGSLKAVPASEIRPGDQLLVSAGERIAVDGEISAGEGEADASLVTGESAPVTLKTGDRVWSGMVNLGAALTVRATAAREDSLLAEITRLVEAGEQGRSAYVRLADKAAKLYVPLVHLIAFSTLIGWFIIAQEPRPAIINAIAVLIISCPCALALAVPAVQVVACGRLYRDGVLVRSGDALERLEQVSRVVLDKTGTLTQGRPRLINGDDIAPETLALAARLARVSRHPLSLALADAAGPGEAADGAVETPGCGVEAEFQGRRVRFGSARWTGAPERPGDEAGEGAFELEAWLVDGDAPPVRFVFADQLRADAAEMIAALRARGLEPELLSGDREEPVAAIARALGVTHWRSGLTPAGKTARLKELADAGEKTLMVGDGLNDAPALAGAYASISMGSAADISRSAADLVIQRDRLTSIPLALDVARAARRRVDENFALTILYNVIAVPIAVLGFVTPLVAAVAMSASSVVVTVNAMRLMRR
ncbi:cadmium-translocating P-type ATPase [Alkalicaulis satelles]|uniref:Cadmium-translocating P-type ATPase n=1 Tax=Alkalicaulis satelles TaxID=2609175 RepID=A0A5M6ZKJ3_9PROT|nr:heavy metal translocating P-type ATPase [Alkalicaulis satelles]KAA5805362.1 cadmium-translocating P-type ATPase [Alkalicaulis satelles]